MEGRRLRGAETWRRAVVGGATQRHGLSTCHPDGAPVAVEEDAAAVTKLLFVRLITKGRKNCGLAKNALGLLHKRPEGSCRPCCRASESSRTNYPRVPHKFVRPIYFSALLTTFTLALRPHASKFNVSSLNT